MPKILPTLYLNKQRVSSKTGEAPLHFKHIIQGKKTTFPLRIKVAPEVWNQDLQRVEGDATLTEKITELREAWHVRYNMFKDEPNAREELQNVFRESINKEVKSNTTTSRKIVYSFYDIFDKYKEYYEPSLTYDHLKKFKTVKDALEGYYPTLDYSELTKQLFDDFQHRQVKKGLSNNYIKDQFKIIKTACKYARSLGMTIPIYIDDYKVQTYRGEIIWLTKEELEALENVKCIDKEEQEIKDCFLFRCYTGVRYSDMQHIKITNLKGNVLQFTIQKQYKLHSIPLGEKSMGILKKYGQLPAATNQRENVKIKILCQRAKIKDEIELHKLVGKNLITEKFKKHKKIASHTARRTFARLAYEKDPTKLKSISRFLGHSSIVTTERYIGVASTDLENLSS